MMIDGIEIERRFLVDGRAQKEWRGGDSISIFQCYLTGVSHIDGSIAWNGSTLVNDDRELSISLPGELEGREKKLYLLPKVIEAVQPLLSLNGRCRGSCMIHLP